MNNEIEFYYDQKGEKKVNDRIEFEPVMAGQSTQKKIYIHNTILQRIELQISIEGKYSKIIKNINSLDAYATEEIIIEFKPEMMTLKPIKAKLNVSLKYTIE